MKTGSEQGKQIILASHSPEFIVRTPSECIRWIERGSPTTQPDETRILLDRLGVTPDTYLTNHQIPDVIVYVEGKTDKPVIENLIQWCRQKQGGLPSVAVVPNLDGRFEAASLRSLHRFCKERNFKTRIVGIRDLDWDYNELPDIAPKQDVGEGWLLLTLPCKELENLFCTPELLYMALGEKISLTEIESIVNEESRNKELVKDWSYQAKPKIRERLSNKHDHSSKERETEERFDTWQADPLTRRRFVAGKELFRQVRQRLRAEFKLTIYPQRAFDHVSALPPVWASIAESIFPDVKFPIWDDNNTPS